MADSPLLQTPPGPERRAARPDPGRLLARCAPTSPARRRLLHPDLLLSLRGRGLRPGHQAAPAPRSGWGCASPRRRWGLRAVRLGCSDTHGGSRLFPPALQLRPPRPRPPCIPAGPGPPAPPSRPCHSEAQPPALLSAPPPRPLPPGLHPSSDLPPAHRPGALWVIGVNFPLSQPQHFTLLLEDSEGPWRGAGWSRSQSWSLYPCACGRPQPGPGLTALRQVGGMGVGGGARSVPTTQRRGPVHGDRNAETHPCQQGPRFNSCSI